VADLGAALLVFEMLRPRRPLQLAARSAILVAVSLVLFVASGIHGDRVGVAVARLLLAIYLLVDRDAPLVAGITLAVASQVEPMVLLAAPVAMAAVAAGATLLWTSTWWGSGVPWHGGVDRRRSRRARSPDWGWSPGRWGSWSTRRSGMPSGSRPDHRAALAAPR
jgi:hypothetical protein